MKKDNRKTLLTERKFFPESGIYGLFSSMLAYNERMRKALMIGSTVADVMIRVDHLPSLEEDVNPFGQTVALGGCCCNAANMLHLYRQPYTLFSPVGTGVFGTFVRTRLEEKGITPVLNPEEENGCCYCIVDAQGNRTFLAVHGAEYRFRKEWFDSLDARDYTDAYVCGLELEEETGDCIVSFLQDNPHLQIFFAPSSRILYVPDERMDAVLACHPVLHLNRRESVSWLKSRGHSVDEETSFTDLAKQLYQYTGNTVIITDGENGAFAYDGMAEYVSPAVPAVPVDGTGAGDCHIGTMIACSMMGKTLQESLDEAAVNSAAVVGRHGAALSEEEFRILR